MGAGPSAATAVQPNPRVVSAAPPAPSLPTILARLGAQLGDREKLPALLAELVDAIDEMREGGPLRLQLNVRPDARPHTQAKVAGVSIQRDERLW